MGHIVVENVEEGRGEFRALRDTSRDGAEVGEGVIYFDSQGSVREKELHRACQVGGKLS